MIELTRIQIDDQQLYIHLVLKSPINTAMSLLLELSLTRITVLHL